MCGLLVYLSGDSGDPDKPAPTGRLLHHLHFLTSLEGEAELFISWWVIVLNGLELGGCTRVHKKYTESGLELESAQKCTIDY